MNWSPDGGRWVVDCSATGDLDAGSPGPRPLDGGSLFSASTSYTVGSVSSVVVADLNADGHPDMAYGFGYSFAVLYAASDGGFAGPYLFSVDAGINHVAAGDFNDDGLLDLAGVGFFSGHVYTQLNLEDGGFEWGSATQTSPYLVNLTGVVAGDVNRDGATDLLISAYSSGIYELFGDGDGGVRSAESCQTGGEATDLAIGDFNGDGLLDVAVADRGYDEVSVFLRNVDGGCGQNLSRIIWSGTVYDVTRIAISDLDRDGAADLVGVAWSGTWTRGGIYLRRGRGDGTFEADNVFNACDGDPAAVAARDVNSDGVPDLIVANSGGEVPVVLLGNGRGGFAYHERIPIQGGVNSITVADLNADGLPDLVFATATGVSVALHQ